LLNCGSKLTEMIVDFIIKAALSTGIWCLKSKSPLFFRWLVVWRTTEYCIMCKLFYFYTAENLSKVYKQTSSNISLRMQAWFDGQQWLVNATTAPLSISLIKHNWKMVKLWIEQFLQMCSNGGDHYAFIVAHCDMFASPLQAA
jgi:hypothetical protein